MKEQCPFSLPLKNPSVPLVKDLMKFSLDSCAGMWLLLQARMANALLQGVHSHRPDPR